MEQTVVASLASAIVPLGMKVTSASMNALVEGSAFIVTTSVTVTFITTTDATPKLAPAFVNLASQDPDVISLVKTVITARTARIHVLCVRDT